MSELVPIVVVALSTAEASRLAACEAVIDRGLQSFAAVGQALREIRDSKLYRSLERQTFEVYCWERWRLTRRRAYQLIEAAGVIENLKMCTMVHIPDNERQVRELASLSTTEQQVEVWTKVWEDGGTPTAAKIAAVIADLWGETAMTSTPAAVAHVSFNSGENEWYTPARYLRLARIVMGGIDCDPASSEIANRTIPRYPGHLRGQEREVSLG